MFDDIARVTEKIIMELNKKNNEKFAIDFAQKLTDAGIKVTKIYGPSVEPVNVRRTEFREVKLDFSEHDKKVYGEAEKRLDEVRTENHALRKQVEELEKQNTDIQNSHMKLYNDSKDEIRELKETVSRLEEDNSKYASANAMYIAKLEECENSNERLNKKIREMEAEIQRLREKCGEVPIDTDKTCVSDCEPDYESLCRKLQDQRQQDCITINQLHVTIDKLVDRYANLRKNVGMD